MKRQEEFIINEYINLKLEQNITNIYIKGAKFLQCKILLRHFSSDDPRGSAKLDSIDEFIYDFNENEEALEFSISDYIRKQDYQYSNKTITPEIEFWAHCSSLQAWVENNYDSKLLHSSLAFPILKKLTEIGDIKAKRVFKEEIARRFSSGFLPSMKFLFINNYLDFLSPEEKTVMVENIEVLDLSNCNLQEIPEFTFKAKKLKKLFLYKNHIKYLPKELGDLNNLEILYLSFNELSKIPDWIEKCISLKELYLESNKIEELPSTLDKLKNIEILNIGRNLLKSIPIEIGNLEYIQELYLDNNKLRSLPNSFEKLKFLKILYLSSNKFTYIPSPLYKNTSIEYLDLGNNKIQKIDQKILEMPSLKTVNLSQNKLDVIPKILKNKILKRKIKMLT